MHKGIKISGKVFAAIVLSVVVLPLAASLLLRIPAVQNFAVQKAVRAISDRLETTVAIRRVDVGFLGKVFVEGFYVEDYQRDTLLYVDRLDAYITGLGLFGGGLTFSRGEIVGAKLCLRETPEGEMNIKQVVGRISDPDRPRKGNFRLSLHRASIAGMELCIERTKRRNPPYGIDFGHLHLYDMQASVNDFTIDGQAIYTTIDTFSARERSGFVLDRLSGRFYLVNGCLGFEQASIRTPRSEVSIPYISLVGNSWADYKDFVGEVRIDGALRNTSLSTDDIAYFSPKLREWHVLFSEINVDIAGAVADFETSVRSMRIGEQSYLAATATVRGLPDIRHTVFDLNLSRLTTSAADLETLARNIARRELPENLSALLARAGRIGSTARFRGSLSSFDLRAGITTAAGNLRAGAVMKPLGEGIGSLRGDLTTSRFRLGRLLGRTDLLGDATLSVSIDGVVGRGTTDARVVGEVSQLEFRGYSYDSLRLDGRLRNRGFDGTVVSRDAALDFDFAGAVDFNEPVPHYDFTLDLRRADLAALHINPRDSISVLAGHVDANVGGRSLDDLNGVIRVSDASYRYNDKTIETRSAVVTGENSAHSKYVELRSDFADVTFRSKTSYKTVFRYLRESAWKYLPLLGKGGRDRPQEESRTAVADDYSLLSVHIRDFNPVADAVSSGLQIADGSSLQLLFNPASDKLSLKADAEYIERKRLLATRLNINASNRGDSLAVYASAEDLYAGALHLPHFSVTGGARKNRMQLSAGFEDTVRRFSGLLSLQAEADDSTSRSRVVDLRILPSHITRGEMRWQIFANRIRIDTSRILIDRFFVKNRDQDLLLDGIASRSLDDSVTLRLRNFDLAPFSQIAERMGYLVEGRTNGGATMKSVLRGGEFRADILFDSLEVNDIPAPPLRLFSRWDFARNRAGVTVFNREKNDTLVRGYFAPDRMRYYARLNVDSLDMGLLDPVLSGVISSTGGLASAELILQGEHRNADLTGQIRVRDLSTTVDFTQVTYTVPEAVLDVRGNRFRSSNVPIFDPEGNRGRLDIDLNLQHLSNIAYDLRVAPDNMLVLDTSDDDNDFFYGRVYASGMARISGDKGQVEMDIAAQTEDGSSFSMPLSNKANISYADFVVFEKPAPTDTLDKVMRKKLSFERRRRRETTGGNRMNIALALDVRPNVEVELAVSGNTVKARGEGSLNLQIDPRSNVFEMYGDYAIREGTYQLSLQNIINKRFTIESGSTIQWTGAPMDALLDIDAVYKVKASLQPLLQGTTDKHSSDRSVPVECVIRLGDRLSNPSVTFEVHVPASDPETQIVVANALSTPESVNMQFLYLLLFNSFLAENNAASSSNIGESLSAATGLEFLSNQLSNWLSTSDYNLVIRYRPKSELTGDEVDFGLSKSLIDDRLLVEIEGNYLIDNKQAVDNNALSNFMGEAYVTYLIDRAGTLKLKAFTQTIDRFDENQGLQETGIGVYYKEDFNNFRDFRQRVRERFTNKKRQARRAARRAAKEQEKAAGGEAETEN
ncbi:MAG: translocation/assembly module TamB domain-containing protein [Alistipes sp.]|nr:translocation/assembly module TamB domain-containing protein [Alistipes senegalensis]MCM1250065.1 translocation/assembly module TamB domain-containing protein [Alistipes sp.]